jgi:hypothetical protein
MSKTTTIKTVWVLETDTESGDHDLFVFDEEPTNEQLFYFMKENLPSEFEEVEEYFEDDGLNWESTCSGTLSEQEVLSVEEM